MSSEEVKKKIADYLAAHRKMALATATSKCEPMAHTVEYVSEGMTVYFATGIDTVKAKNINANPSVAYTVDEDYDDWMKIQGVQMEGKASILAHRPEIEHAAALYMQKFPFVKDLPSAPHLIFIKVEPVVGWFLDYTKGFMHKERVEFETEKRKAA